MLFKNMVPIMSETRLTSVICGLLLKQNSSLLHQLNSRIFLSPPILAKTLDPAFLKVGR